MSNGFIYRTLVPNAPLYRRTEGDEDRGSLFSMRSKLNGFLLENGVTPGLQEPTLISSYEGSIDQILFCFPKWFVTNNDSVQAYRSVIDSLRLGTKFIIVHHESTKNIVQSWLIERGHKENDVIYIQFPDYVSLTDWAEDAYVSVKDSADGSQYLIEPWEFKRSGDALIADAVEEFSNIKASQVPLIFQGGNCLIGSDFWLLGKDYFADTIDLLNGQRPPVTVPDGRNIEDFARELFSKFVDNKRKLILVGTKKPIPIKQYAATKVEGVFLLDIAAGGAGTFQPIFHIDMCVSLLGKNTQGNFEVLVGSPALADRMLGTNSPFSLDDVYDGIANSFIDLGFEVKRNPLVHRPTLGEKFTFSKLKEIALQPGFTALFDAMKEFSVLGAVDTSTITIRDWHHITWNNCLVENSASEGKHVYLPTFGNGKYSDLKPIDEEMKKIWESLGFNVHQLGDFNTFAERQGVVHCIKKYLSRGS